MSNWSKSVGQSSLLSDTVGLIHNNFNVFAIFIKLSIFFSMV
jgi:hypothetical protein